MGAYFKLLRQKTHVSRAYSEPGIVVNALPFISLNHHNKPMWVSFSYIIPILQVRKWRHRRLSNLPGLHSWKTVELALQPGQSGSWAFALTYSAYCLTRGWKRCQTTWGWRPKAKLVQAQKVHVTSLTLNKKILENIKCPPMWGQLTVFWALLHQCACTFVCMRTHVWREVRGPIFLYSGELAYQLLPF